MTIGTTRKRLASFVPGALCFAGEECPGSIGGPTVPPVVLPEAAVFRNDGARVFFDPFDFFGKDESTPKKDDDATKRKQTVEDRQALAFFAIVVLVAGGMFFLASRKRA